jgi:uncharacterized protein YsxB (DUF464 family)
MERIASFVITGHAQYDHSGRDIVCAGVSAVTVGTINSIERLTGSCMTVQLDDEKGLLKARTAWTGDVQTDEQIQLLLESMVVMLEGIVESYGEYVEMNPILHD